MHPKPNRDEAIADAIALCERARMAWVTGMDDAQLRGDTLGRNTFVDEPVDEPVLDPFVYDYGKSGHKCPSCDIGLSTVECTPLCPHSRTCEDFQAHHSAGAFWCPIDKEG